MSKLTLPRLILTLGEPAGIGPDIALKSAGYELQAQLVVIGDPDLLEHRARRLGTAIELIEFVPDSEPNAAHAGALLIYPPGAGAAGRTRQAGSGEC